MGEGVDWRKAAVCATTDPRVFFPMKGGSTAAAKRLCASCPVREACLEEALAGGLRHGVWGGLSRQERLAHPGWREPEDPLDAEPVVVVPVAAGFKRCAICQEPCPVGEFWADSKAADGLNSWCKGCSRKRSVARRDRRNKRSRDLRAQGKAA